MGELEKTTSAGERRRGSLVSNELVATGLSSEDDAAVLGMRRMFNIPRPWTKEPQPSLDTSRNCDVTSP